MHCSTYLFLLHSTCSMKSLLDLICDVWIQFFLASYHDKSKWFSYLWTMNMNKKSKRWSLEDISMVEEMNYETNVRQLVVLQSMYTFFFLEYEIAWEALQYQPHSSTTKYTSISWYPQTLTLIIIHVKFDFFFLTFIWIKLKLYFGLNWYV